MLLLLTQGLLNVCALHPNHGLNLKPGFFGGIMARKLSLIFGLLLLPLLATAQAQNAAEANAKAVMISSTDGSPFFVRALLELSDNNSQVQRISFKSCIRGLPGESSVCSTIGRSRGYTLAELEARDRELTGTKMVRSVARIAFPVSGLIIGAGNGWKRAITAGKGRGDLSSGFALAMTPFYAITHGAIGAVLGYGASVVVLTFTEDANAQSETIELAKKATDPGRLVLTDMNTADLLLNLNTALAGIK